MYEVKWCNEKFKGRLFYCMIFINCLEISLLSLNSGYSSYDDGIPCGKDKLHPFHR